MASSPPTTSSCAPASRARPPAARSAARRVFATVAEALDGVDVLIDFTSHEVVKDNALTAIGRGVAVVIGTSGLTADDFEEIDAAARERGVGAVAAGNFSLTAAMAQAAALLVAPHLPHWEVIDYASAAKADVPSGTARELAERLGAVQPSVLGRPLDEIAGSDRGARRERRRRPGPLGPAAELRRLDRGRVRPARRAAGDPPRRRRIAGALRGGNAAGGPRGERPGGAHARARPAAAHNLSGARPRLGCGRRRRAFQRRPRG